LSEQHPDLDAVICFNDLVALGMLSGFLTVGRVVGRDIRVVGFDDIEECTMAYPPLSSVRCDIADFGRQTAANLLAWLEEGLRPAPERRTPVSLVARASSLGA
jgi:LacI family transcriptional regulator